jgi:DUF971 family protein
VTPPDTSAITPAGIDVQRDHRVTITFEDGAVCEFPVRELRAACPCAACRGMRELGRAAWPLPGLPDTISVSDAHLNGAWGLSIDWSDGHNTGIYAWAVLRRWWDAGLGEPMVIDPVLIDPIQPDPAAEPPQGPVDNLRA